MSSESASKSSNEMILSHNILSGKRILVVGGSGRVGGSVVTQLTRWGANVTVGGTNIQSFQTARQRWMDNNANNNHDENKLASIEFKTLNCESAQSIANVLLSQGQQAFDLVVHTAGPFQNKVKTPNGVLEACISQSVPYIDCCDDYCTAMAYKSKFSHLASEAGIPCIVSTGCWPGVSSLMALQLVHQVLTRQQQQQQQQVDDNNSTTTASKMSPNPFDLDVNFSFFTAGSGGAGATLLVATFLILAEQALTIVNGRRTPVKAMKQYKDVSFGPIVGTRSIAHLNLLETASINSVLGVGNVSSRFGTAPNFWNSLLGLMAQLPPSLLSNQDLMTKLALFSLPIVRLVDQFAGATNAMRVDVSSSKDNQTVATALYAHENLEPCVGECISAFCVAILANKMVEPGVWFPEEAIAPGPNAAAVLSLASIGAHTLEVNGTMDIKHSDVWGQRQQQE